jgi:hypothetical protein
MQAALCLLELSRKVRLNLAQEQPGIASTMQHLPLDLT